MISEDIVLSTSKAHEPFGYKDLLVSTLNFVNDHLSVDDVKIIQSRVYDDRLVVAVGNSVPILLCLVILSRNIIHSFFDLAFIYHVRRSCHAS